MTIKLQEETEMNRENKRKQYEKGYYKTHPCGALSSNRVAADDSPMKLMSIAMKPLSAPPFPLEKIKEMTDLMAGDGKLRP